MELHEKQSDAKNRAIARLIEDVRTSRAAGKPVDDEMAVAAIPDLMPELCEALVKLRRIEAAGLTWRRLGRRRAMRRSRRQMPVALLAELQRPADSNSWIYDGEGTQPRRTGSSLSGDSVEHRAEDRGKGNGASDRSRTKVDGTLQT